jgi:capsule polysaccharide export protein KpsE/RkpR
MQRVAVTEAGQRRVFFEQQVEAAKKSLAQAEQALRATQEKTGVIQLDGQAKAIIESVVTLRARMAAKQVQVDAMKAFATDQNPDLILANQELAGMRRQLSKMESQQSTSGDSVAIPTGNVPESGLEYVRRLRDVKYYESVFELLGKQYEMAKLDEARQGSVVQTIDSAVEPDRKSSPRRGLILALTGVLAFLGSCLCALLTESVRRMKAVDPEQAERISKLKELLIGRGVRPGLKGGAQ